MRFLGRDVLTTAPRLWLPALAHAHDNDDGKGFEGSKVRGFEGSKVPWFEGAPR